MDRNDIRMLEACYDPRFLQKSHLSRFAYTGLEYFDSHLPLEVGVPGKINICHASTSNALNEAIVADMLSREINHFSNILKICLAVFSIMVVSKILKQQVEFVKRFGDISFIIQ